MSAASDLAALHVGVALARFRSWAELADSCRVLGADHPQAKQTAADADAALQTVLCALEVARASGCADELAVAVRAMIEDVVKRSAGLR